MPHIARFRTSAALGAALVLTPVPGCFHETVRSRTQTVRLAAQPDGAYLWRVVGARREPVGPAPQTVTREAQARHRVFRKSLWALPAVFGAGVVGGVGALGALNFRGEESIGPAVVAGASVLGLIPSLVICALYQSRSDRGQLGLLDRPADDVYAATLDGHLERTAKVRFDAGDLDLRLVLPRAPGAVATTPAPARPGGTIIAVFDVQDAGRRFQAASMDQLTEYLATRLAESGTFRVVPRDQLRQRLVEQRAQGSRECYDQGCQIELGKAIAAQKSLATKIVAVGERCAITAALFDLRTETTEKAASARTDCSADALMDGMDQIVRQLGGAGPAPK